jgi:hypothetical protein
MESRFMRQDVWLVNVDIFLGLSQRTRAAQAADPRLYAEYPAVSRDCTAKRSDEWTAVE